MRVKHRSKQVWMIGNSIDFQSWNKRIQEMLFSVRRRSPGRADIQLYLVDLLIFRLTQEYRKCTMNSSTCLKFYLTQLGDGTKRFRWSFLHLLTVNNFPIALVGGSTSEDVCSESWKRLTETTLKVSRLKLVDIWDETHCRGRREQTIFQRWDSVRWTLINLKRISQWPLTSAGWIKVPLT